MKDLEENLRPRLSPTIQQQIAAIEPSITDKTKFFPCVVTFDDGSQLDKVYLIEQYSYIRIWGSYPQNEIDLKRIVSVTESPLRLPAKYANELYLAGESGMGYLIFTVVFSDGSNQAYVTGNLIDFLDYPEGKTGADVVEVLPHVGREAFQRHFLKPEICLYADEETERVFPLGLTRPEPMARRTPLDRIKAYFRRLAD